MAKFIAAFSKNPTNTGVGVMSLEAPAANPRRIKLSDLILGSDAVQLGTSAWRFDVQRSTSAAGGAAVPAAPTDLGDTSLVSQVKSALTANGALTANAVLLSIPLMQQATFRWVARDGFELVVPAANANGLHLLTPVAGGTLQVAGSLAAEEQ